LQSGGQYGVVVEVVMMIMMIKLIASLYKMPLCEGVRKPVTSRFAMFGVKARKGCANDGEFFFCEVELRGKKQLSNKNLMQRITSRWHHFER
jgi:hypothetical protein